MSIFSASSFKADQNNLIKNDKITLQSSSSQSTSNTLTIPVVTTNEEIAIKSQVASLSSNNTFTGTNTFQNTITAQSFTSTQDTLVRNSKVKINSAASQSNIFTATLPVMTADDTIALTSQIPSLTNVARLDADNYFTGNNHMPTLRLGDPTSTIIGVNVVANPVPSDAFLLTEAATMQQVDKKIAKTNMVITDQENLLRVTDNSSKELFKIRSKFSHNNKLVQLLNNVESSVLRKASFNNYPNEILDVSSLINSVGNGYVHYSLGNQSGVTPSNRGYWWDAGSFYLPLSGNLDRSIHLTFTSSYSFYRTSDSSLYNAGYSKYEAHIVKTGTQAPIITMITNTISPNTAVIYNFCDYNIGGATEHLTWGLSTDTFGMNGSAFFDVTVLITTYN